MLTIVSVIITVFNWNSNVKLSSKLVLGNIRLGGGRDMKVLYKNNVTELINLCLFLLYQVVSFDQPE